MGEVYRAVLNRIVDGEHAGLLVMMESTVIDQQEQPVADLPGVGPKEDAMVDIAVDG